MLKQVLPLHLVARSIIGYGIINNKISITSPGVISIGGTSVTNGDITNSGETLSDEFNRLFAKGEDGANTGTSAQGLSKAVSQKASEIADYVKNHNGTPPQGYVGGRKYLNDGREEGQKLPEGVNYKEYDANPKVAGQGRGTERIDIGDDGSVWYTNDHYKTFTRME